MTATPRPVPHVVNQQVTASGGFAYGTVGADIQVFGDGAPRYLLEKHRPAPNLDLAWLHELPSRMLSARSQVVPFTGRRPERDELAEWRDLDTHRLAVRWLHAPGGQGKTRLADQFAADAAEQDWNVVFAVHDVGAAADSPGSQDLRTSRHRGVLLIVDYADRWTARGGLTWLLRNSLLHQAGVPARVLLLARTLAGWPALRAALQDPLVRAGTSEQSLAPLTDDHDNARRHMFVAARDSFAAVYGLPDSTTITVPAGLAGPEFGLTLTVHVAAMVAVDARATGAEVPTDPAQLTSYLLDREEQHWERLYEERTRGLDYQTPPSVMARTAFTACLTGPLPHADAVGLLADCEQELPAERLLTDHARCYPPAEPDGRTALEPLYPDRLAEDFLALTLPGAGVASSHAWAVTRLSRLLSRPIHPGRALTFLIAAAARWPHLGPAHLYPLLRARPDIALSAGGAALATLAAIPNVDLDMLEGIDAQLPTRSHVDLDVAAEAIATRLIEHRLAGTSDPAERARLHTDHTLRLVNAGQYAAALHPAEQAVAIDRRLAESDPDRHRPSLAMSLTNLGNVLFGLGRTEPALAAAMESTAILTPLAQKDPEIYLPLATVALDQLGVKLLLLGRTEQALSHGEVAVDLRRMLVAADPDTYVPGLAASLNHLGSCLTVLGRYEEALASFEEGTGIYRRLAEADPDAYLPHLAGSVGNLGLCQAALDHPELALAAVDEAITLYRRLVESNPDAYLPGLARSLTWLCHDLSEVGRVDEAVSAGAEAVSIQRRLAAAIPAAYLPSLADSLVKYARSCTQTASHLMEAYEAATEAINIYESLVEALPEAYTDPLLSAFGVFAEVMDRLGFTEEAASFRRQIAEDADSRAADRDIRASRAPGPIT